MNVHQEIDRVFQVEIDTLVKVRQALNEQYTRAVEMIFACSGKVVVTGMGKSGLVAQKIASTMVSTGTLAIFLHPGDGMHGDVGIVQKGDVVLAVSKSGETEDLLNVLLYVGNIGVPVISITAKPESAMAKASNLVLYTPVDEEACPLNLAPTSSTTAALVLGDALAMALMKMRDFQPDQFALLHPGGQLGKRLLMKVSDIMRSGENNPVVKVSGTIHEMLYEITGKLSGAVSIIDDDGNLLGLVTDHDIRSVLEEGKDLFSLNIAEIMNEGPTFIRTGAMAVEALNLMENRAFLVLPVLEEKSDKVAGMVHIHDLVSQGL